MQINRFKGKTWTQQEDAYLREHYQIKGAIYCARDMNKELGSSRTKHSVESRARRLNAPFDPPQQYSLKELSEMTNISVKNILQHIRANNISFRKKQNKIFVTMQNGESILNYYEKKDSFNSKGLLSVKEASEKLSCDPTAIRHAIHTNDLPFQRKGKMVFIDNRIILLAEKQMEVTGNPKVNWRKVKDQYEKKLLDLKSLHTVK
jgi:hypothetical protein